MHNKYINSTSSRKYLTENEFGDIDVLHVQKCLLSDSAFPHFGNAHA